jgi:hypothetical protein
MARTQGHRPILDYFRHSGSGRPGDFEAQMRKIATMSMSRKAQARQAGVGRQSVGLDSWVLIPALLLISIGLVMVGSASISIAEGQQMSVYHYLMRHSLYLILGVCLAAYEQTLKNKYAGRIRPQIDTRGFIETVDSIVQKKTRGEGFQKLQGLGLEEFLFEHVVVENPQVFSEEAVDKSVRRLAELN